MTDQSLLKRGVAVLALFLTAGLHGASSGQVQTNVPDVVPGAQPTTIERIKIHGTALEGNLEGDAVDRDVIVVLPPSYQKERTRRYPVVYALHGYSIGADQWTKEIHVPQTVEGAFARGAREMIVVLPDSKTVHNGSMYSSSVTTGDFETFVARDVVAYVDAHYRTLATRESRGLVGHSMGGYGATRIGMKHADVFGALYIMSPCCLSARGAGPANPANDEALAAVKTPEDSAKLPFGLRAQLASAAAWSPNPKNPPLYLDLPVGANQQAVLARWGANAPLAFIDQYVAGLRRYRAIAIDVGDQDGLKTDTGKLHDVLTTYGIAHDFEIYPGTHTSDVAVRFQNHVMPFFSRTLSFDPPPPAVSPAAREEVALKDVAPKGMAIGVAINQRQSDGVDAAAVELITKQFNQISPENLLKFQSVHPAADRYAFEAQDRYVQFGVDRKMQVIGHNLIWHKQTPAWVFQGADGKPADRETLLARMRDHIHTVVGRYKGRIHGWDVVNEAVEDDGTLRKTAWRDGIGDDYVAKAFEFAREADPGAELYYNDYNLEKPAKRAGVIRLVKDLRKRGLRIDGIGNQAHWHLETPSIVEIEKALTELHGTGLKVMYTELDINMLPNATPGTAPANPYANGLPADKQQQLAARYADIFRLIVKHHTWVSRVTFWGLSDADSWLNRGAANYPLLWDRQRQPKPAFQAVVDALRRGR